MKYSTGSVLSSRLFFQVSALLLPLVNGAVGLVGAETGGGGYQATGIKITEPTASTVTIWTRVTRDAERAGDDRPLPITRLFDRATGAAVKLRENASFPTVRPELTFPVGTDFGSIRGAAVGAPGQTRVRYRDSRGGAWRETVWRDVDVSRDFTAVFSLVDLPAAARLVVAVDSRPREGAATTATVLGGFVTAPLGWANVAAKFCVMSCQQYEDRDLATGFAIYPAMQSVGPDFFVNTGDVLYYDHGPVIAVTAELARYHWARMFSYPTLREFHSRVGSFFMKDDHDVLSDDSHPGGSSGDFTFADGLRIFREQTAPSEPPYRVIRWGRHLEVWLLEGRDFRSTREQDRTQVPTILGAAQIAWLEKTLAASDATYRVVITPTPMVGPDRLNKDDNYANQGYVIEGTRIRSILSRYANLTVITGDRHWQYVSRDVVTGIEEWSVGAASDAHAGGWSETQPRPEHRFLRTKYGGFLSGEVTVTAGVPALTFRLHAVDGAVVFASTKAAAK